MTSSLNSLGFNIHNSATPTSVSRVMTLLGNGNVGIGTITPNYILDVSGSTNIDGNTTITGSLIVTTSVTASSYTGSFVGDGSQLTGIISSKWSGSNPITRDSDVEITGSFNVAGQTTLFSTGSGTLKVQGSGSDQPVFTVQGSTGELFSVTDSLTGSLFSVNDISGLPILEVFSDNTTLIGNYLDPMLITTAKVTQTNSGSFVLYSLPTASYDTAFFEYSVRSGSNARAGTIMAIQSGSAVNFTETTTTDFGSTTAISFVVVVTGSNMALTGSSTTGSWTIKSIIRGI